MQDTTAELRAVDLNLLVALSALLEEGGVTKAAARVGLSAPAMSHALARLREQLDDPLLVRAGREMVLTERALALAPRVRELVEQLRVVLFPEEPEDAARWTRTFRIRASDYVLLVLGRALDAAVRDGAPGLTLRFDPNGDDATALREGRTDLAVGVYSGLPPEIRRRKLFGERLVCVVRRDHPQVKRRPSLARYAALEHVQVAPRGRPGGAVDAWLAKRGHTRRVARAVPYFHSALALVAQTDYVLTVPERAARVGARDLGLRVLEAPVELRPYSVVAIWHPRSDADPAHRWLRRALVEAAEDAGARAGRASHAPSTNT